MTDGLTFLTWVSWWGAFSRIQEAEERLGDGRMEGGVGEQPARGMGQD